MRDQIRRWVGKTFENVRKRLKIFEKWCETFENIRKFLNFFDLWKKDLRVWARRGTRPRRDGDW